jgi:hypothetical protein
MKAAALLMKTREKRRRYAVKNPQRIRATIDLEGDFVVSCASKRGWDEVGSDLIRD